MRHPSQPRSALASDQATPDIGAQFYPRKRSLSKRVSVVDWLAERFAEA
ncbi:hypothetical protein [Pseudomonas sp.]